MDTLVSRYARPMFENEGYSQNDQQDLYESVPSLSLKFAMPPVAQVCIRDCSPSCSAALQVLIVMFASCTDLNSHPLG